MPCSRWSAVAPSYFIARLSRSPRAFVLGALMCCAASFAPAQVMLVSGYNFGQFIGAGYPALDGNTGDPVGSIGSNFRLSTQAPNSSGGDFVGQNGLAGNFSNGFGRLYWDGTNGSSNYNSSLGVQITATNVGPNSVNGQTVQGYTLSLQGDGGNLALTTNVANNRLAFVQNTTGFLDFNPTDYVNGPNVTSDANLTFAASVTAPVTVSWYLGGSATPFATTNLTGSAMASYSVDLPAAFYNQGSSTLVAQFSGTATLDNVQFNGIAVGSGGGGATFWKNGDGVWTAATTPTNWRDASGATQGAWTTPGAATFRGTAGTVTVDNTGGQVVFTGATFSTTGYMIAGGNLSTTTAGTPVQVGDATAATATMNATISAPIIGTGGLDKTGQGTLTLSGNNTYTGNTTVTAGKLIVNGDQSGATGAVSVTSAGTLGGSGTLGNVTVQSGGVLLGQTGSVLTLSGLSLGATSQINVTLGAPATTGLFKVNGALTLDGTINVAGISGFGAGLYHIFDYTGALTNNTLLLGTVSGTNATGVGPGEIQTSVTNQVNIVFGASTGGNTTGNNTTGGNTTGGNTTGGNTTGGGVMVGTLPLWTGGNGTWTVAGNSTSWKSVDGTQSGAWQPGGFAIFQAGPGTVTVDNAAGAVVLSGLQFAADGFTVAGGTLTTNTTRTALRAGDGTAAGAGVSGMITTAIAGSGGVEKTDLGTIILAGDSSYTGGTLVSGGTLQIGAGGTSGSIIGNVANSGALVINRSDAVTFAGSITGSGSLTHAGNGTTSLTGTNTFTGGTTISAGTLQVGAGGTTGSLAGNITNNTALSFNRSDALTVSGVVSGNGSVTQVGTGTTTLTGNNTYTGGTTITAGALQIGAGGTAGAITGNVANNAQLNFNRSDAFSFDGVVSGTGSILQAGTGTTTLTGNNTYTGVTNVNAGTLLINGTQSGASGAVLVGGGGTLGGIGATGGNVTVQNGGTVTGAAGSVFTMAGLTLNSGSQTNLSLGAPGTTALFQVNGNQVPGNVTIDGWLNFGAASGFAPGSHRLIDYTGTLTNNTLQFGSAPVNPGDLTVQTSVAGQVNLNFAATVSDYWTGGNGTWTAAAGNTSWQNYSGAAAGAWQSRTATFGGTAGTVTVDTTGGAVALTGAQFLTTGYTVAGGNLTTTTAETVLQVGNGSAAGATANATISSIITGTGGLVKTDLGTLTLTGANIYTGNTTINSGTLLVNGNHSAATGAVTVAAGGRLGGTGTAAGVSVLDGGTLFGSAGSTFTMASLTLSSASRLSVTLDAPAATPTPIFQVNGALTLGGVLDITNATGYGPGLYRLFNYTGSFVNNGLLIGSNPISALIPTIQTSVANQVNLLVGVAPLPIWAGGSGTWSAATTGTGWGAVDGTYQGGWQPGMAIFQGTAGTVNVDPTAGPVVVTGIQFASSGYTVAGGALTTNTANTVLRVGDGTGAGDAMTATLSAPITGSGGVEKTDLGTLVLSGANTYTGGTTVSGGTLQIGAGGATGSVAGDIANNAALRFNRSDATTVSGVISGAGTVTQAGTGTLTLTGANTYTGGTTVSSGTVQIGAGGTTGSLAGNIANNATVAFNRSDAVTFAGAITGNGTVVQAGAGTTTLTANNTYTGGTVVNAGTLQIGAGGTTGSLAGNIANNATIAFNRSDAVAFAGAIAGSGNLVNAGSGNTTFSGVISGTGNLRQAGTGTTILTAANTYTGGTTIAAGTVQVGAGGTTGNLTGSVTNNGTFAINRSDAVTFIGTITGNGTVVNAGSGNTTFEGVINGSSALRQTGAGTTILTAANTYTGGTTIAAGTLQIGAGGSTGSLTGAITNNGTLAINRSDALTLTGAISGAGALRQEGAGTTILAATNTYTGGTTISSGTLQVGAGAASGSLVGNVTNNGTLAINRSDNTTLEGVVSGTGSLRHLGSGTTTLTGANIYTGGTTISSGTLQIGGGGTAGSITGNVVNSAALAINRSDSYTLDVVVSGNGTLTQAGTGTTTITGAQSYTGGTTITAGTLQLGSGNTAGSVTGNIANNATLAINRSDAVTLVNSISGSGAVVKLGNGTLTLAGNNTYAGGTTVSAGAIEVADSANLGAISGALTLNGGTLRAAAGFTTSRNIVLGSSGGTIDTGANILTAQGVISGAGNLTKSGTGELRIAGAGTHTGTTSIAQGAIFLSGGSLGATSVSVGARLAGSGSINGNLVNAGQLSPGASAGAIAVTGNFSQAATGSFVVELASPTSFDSLSVSGAATLGGTLTVSGLNGYVPEPGQTFRVVTAGSVSGTFASLVSPWSQISPMLRFEALYSSRDVRLSMTQLPFATVRSATPEQAAVGAAVDGAIAQRAIPNLQRALNGLPDTDRVRDALTELSPLRYDRWFQQAVLMAGATVRTAEGRMDQAAREPQGTLWTEVVARGSKFGAGTDRTKAQGNTSGILVGGDVHISPDTQVGMIFGYTSEQLKLDEVGSTTDGSRFATTVYGRYDWTPLFVEAVVGGSYGKLDSRRTIAIPGYARTAMSDTDSRDGYSSVRLGYSFGRRGMNLTPYAALNYIHWSTDATNEVGADEASLKIASRSADSLASRLGLSVSFPRMAETISFTPRLDVAWRHEFRGENGTMAGSLGGSAFTLNGATAVPAASGGLLTGTGRAPGTEKKNGLIAGLGFDVTFGSRLTAYLRLSTERPTSTDQVIEARAGAELRF